MHGGRCIDGSGPHPSSVVSYCPEDAMAVLIAAAAVAAIVIIWGISSYNTLVGLRNRCFEAEAGIDAHLKERSDLIPNLVETVRGYASHESDTLESVIAARSKAEGLSGEARMKAESELGGALGRLLAVAESYPDLKASQSFLDLQGQLSRIEETLANARKYYNAVVRSYNDRIMMFPSSLIASAFRFQERSYIEIDDSERARTEVRF